MATSTRQSRRRGRVVQTEALESSASSSSSTPSSLSRGSADDYGGYSDDSGSGDALSQRERRKRVHLACEHRRRQQISEGLDALRALLPDEDGGRGVSKMEVLSQSLSLIHRLEERRQQLKCEQLRLMLPQ